MFLQPSLTLPRPFPLYAAFPRSEYVWAGPTSTAVSAPLRIASFGRLTRPARGPRLRWISQVPDASVAGRAVLSDPAAVSGGHRLLRPPTVAFQIFDPVGLRMSTHEAQSLHLRYGPSVALPTLSSCRYLHKPKARFPVGWLPPCRCGNFTRWKRQALPGAPK